MALAAIFLNLTDGLDGLAGIIVARDVVHQPVDVVGMVDARHAAGKERHRCRDRVEIGQQ